MSGEAAGSPAASVPPPSELGRRTARRGPP